MPRPTCAGAATTVRSQRARAGVAGSLRSEREAKRRGGGEGGSATRPAGVPAPRRFPNRAETAPGRAEAGPPENGATAETTRRLAGRVMARRDMGKLVFLDLVDRSGRIQLMVRPDEVGAVDVDLGDIVGVEGVATKSRRGEPSLAVGSLELLAKIRAPLPDTFHRITD